MPRRSIKRGGALRLAGGALRLAGGRKGRVRGGFFMKFLKKAHAFVKKHKAISRGANLLGYRSVGRSARALGYGKRKCGRRRR